MSVPPFDPLGPEAEHWYIRLRVRLKPDDADKLDKLVAAVQDETRDGMVRAISGQ